MKSMQLAPTGRPAMAPGTKMREPNRLACSFLCKMAIHPVLLAIHRKKGVLALWLYLTSCAVDASSTGAVALRTWLAMS